jgi:hypothetical protein
MMLMEAKIRVPKAQWEQLEPMEVVATLHCDFQ